MLNLRSVYANHSQATDTLVFSTFEALDSMPAIGWDEVVELPQVREERSRV